MKCHCGKEQKQLPCIITPYKKVGNVTILVARRFVISIINVPRDVMGDHVANAREKWSTNVTVVIPS